MKLEVRVPTTLEKAKSLFSILSKQAQYRGITDFVAIANLAVYMPYSYDASNPSVRLRRLSLRKPLRKVGIRCEIVTRFEDLASFDNVLISHYGASAIPELKSLRAQGKRIFYDHSENLWGFPQQQETFDLCDVIVCCSTQLAKITETRIHPNQTTAVMPDFLEQADALPRHTPAPKEKPKVVWCGMGGNSFMAREIEGIINELGMELVIISEWDDANIKWELDTYLQHMADCDIAICPQRVNIQPAKSNVKVTTAMGLGLPVVCSPLPSYLEVISDGVNGFIAHTPEEWRKALSKLTNVSTRSVISRNALNSIDAYKPPAIASKWLELLFRVPTRVALINSTLKDKYASYGDHWVDYLRYVGAHVDVYPYDDIDSLPSGYDFYLFIEVRYEPSAIADVGPRLLYTTEPQNLNNLPHFDGIVCMHPTHAAHYYNRGFINAIHVDNIDKPTEEWFEAREPSHYDRFSKLKELATRDWQALRKIHNLKIHSDNINAFHSLMQPEARWNGGMRDKIHIQYTEKILNQRKGPQRILDIGSADGWLSLYLATKGHHVTALEFVDRGMAWTTENAKRLGVEVKLHKGFIEEVAHIFHDKKFDIVLAYEILEHLDYRKMSWYVREIDKILAPGGQLLVSLPMQDLRDNPEHLWSPSEALISKAFPGDTIEWVDIPQHEVPGDWFITHHRNKPTHKTGL